MTTACIVQARLGSSRLPAKVLLPLPAGRTVLEEVLSRCKQIPGVDVVVCAIPDTAENDILASFVSKANHVPYNPLFDTPPYPLGKDWAKGVTLVRGPEHDVLARYAKAAAAVNADIILRITSDCPLLDPQVCGELLKLRERTNAGFASNSWPARSYPVGFDCEVFTREALERANAAAPAMSPPGTLFERMDLATFDAHQDREHAGCPWMMRQTDIKKALLKAMDDRSHLRWTLDTLQDYVTIWNEFERREREAA